MTWQKVPPGERHWDGLPVLPVLTAAEVRARAGFTDGQLYYRVRAGTFPAPVRLPAGPLLWRERDVRAWEEARAATASAVSGGAPASPGTHAAR